MVLKFLPNNAKKTLSLFQSFGCVIDNAFHIRSRSFRLSPFFPKVHRQQKVLRL